MRGELAETCAGDVFSAEVSSDFVPHPDPTILLACVAVILAASATGAPQSAECGKRNRGDRNVDLRNDFDHGASRTDVLAASVLHGGLSAQAGSRTSAQVLQCASFVAPLAIPFFAMVRKKPNARGSRPDGRAPVSEHRRTGMTASTYRLRAWPPF